MNLGIPGAVAAAAAAATFQLGCKRHALARRRVRTSDARAHAAKMSRPSRKCSRCMPLATGTRLAEAPITHIPSNRLGGILS